MYARLQPRKQTDTETVDIKSNRIEEPVERFNRRVIGGVVFSTQSTIVYFPFSRRKYT